MSFAELQEKCLKNEHPENKQTTLKIAELLSVSIVLDRKMMLVLGHPPQYLP